MWLLLLRLLIAPLAVVAGTLAQRRFGHAVSGLIIGLPLTSLPLLLLVSLQHGGAFASSMSNADLFGSLAEVAVIVTYIRLAPRLSPALTLVSALVAFGSVALVLHLFGAALLLSGALAVAAFALALVVWPRRTFEPERTGRPRLVLRLVLSAGFTFLVITSAGVVGPGLAGLAAALPVLSLVMAYVTHQELGVGASVRFLKGVTKGSFSYVVSIFTFGYLVRTTSVWYAFVAALGVALVVQLVAQLLYARRAPRRASEEPASQAILVDA